jgi:hypothetical protein
LKYFFWIASLTLAMTIGLSHAGEATEKTFCRVLANYTKDRGVNYMPGVDVRGNEVAPADLDEPLPQFETIEIPVEIDLAARFGIAPPMGAELKPTVALISIHKDGKVEYNGRDISKQTYKVCKE